MHITDRLLQRFDIPSTGAGTFAFEETLQHRRVNITGADRVDANAFRTVITGHGAGQGMHRALCGTIGGKARVSDEAVIGSEIDQAGAAA